MGGTATCTLGNAEWTDNKTSVVVASAEEGWGDLPSTIKNSTSFFFFLKIDPFRSLENKNTTQHQFWFFVSFSFVLPSTIQLYLNSKTRVPCPEAKKKFHTF